MNIYYATLSSSHQINSIAGPGCVEIHAKDISQARQLIHTATNGKWAFMYSSLQDVHPFDRTILETLFTGDDNEI